MIASPGLQPGFNASPSGRLAWKQKEEAVEAPGREGRQEKRKERTAASSSLLPFLVFLLFFFLLLLLFFFRGHRTGAQVKFSENNFHLHLWRRCSTLPLSLPHSPYNISFSSIGCTTLSFESSEFSSRMLSKINRTRNLTIHVNVICSWKKKEKGRGFFSTLFQFHTAISGKIKQGGNSYGNSFFFLRARAFLVGEWWRTSCSIKHVEFRVSLANCFELCTRCFRSNY